MIKNSLTISTNLKILGLVEILVIVKPLPVAGDRKPIQTTLIGQEEKEEIISSHTWEVQRLIGLKPN